jgi:hypothetical protein
MKPKDAKKQLAARVKDAGLKLAKLTPAEGIPLMLEFYKDLRADDCELDNDGDMLLYQWGVYEDLDGGESFHLDITRQFTVSDKYGDDAMSQLGLTFFFKPPAKYKAIKDGNRWCSSPKELKAFRSFIEKSPAYKAVAKLEADDVKLQYSRI